MAERSTRVDSAPAPRLDVAGLIIAAALLVLSAVILWDGSALQFAPTYGLGPKVMPYVLAGGLAVLAVGNALLAWHGAFPVREPLDVRAVALILGGLAAMTALIGLGGGFIPATALLFTATATALGRRAAHVDLAIGFALAIAIYLVFSKLLTLSLPAGPLERLL